MTTTNVDRQALHESLDRVRDDFHALLESAIPEDLARPTNGTRWTNEQLLFHMLLGYLIIRSLLALVRLFGRLPGGVSKAYAGALNAAATGPFDFVNYLGPIAAVHIFNAKRMGAAFDRTVAGLHRRLDAESDADLARAMHYPTRWDPFFKDSMTLADIYRYPAQHYDFHRKQLTLSGHPAS